MPALATRGATAEANRFRGHLVKMSFMDKNCGLLSIKNTLTGAARSHFIR